MISFHKEEHEYGLLQPIFLKNSKTLFKMVHLKWSLGLEMTVKFAPIKKKDGQLMNLIFCH